MTREGWKGFWSKSASLTSWVITREPANGPELIHNNALSWLSAFRQSHSLYFHYRYELRYRRTANSYVVGSFFVFRFFRGLKFQINSRDILKAYSVHQLKISQASRCCWFLDKISSRKKFFIGTLDKIVPFRSGIMPARERENLKIYSHRIRIREKNSRESSKKAFLALKSMKEKCFLSLPLRRERYLFLKSNSPSRLILYLNWSRLSTFISAFSHTVSQIG